MAQPPPQLHPVQLPKSMVYIRQEPQIVTNTIGNRRTDSFHAADGVERETPELGPKPDFKPSSKL